jgi:hypothetical protein
LEFGVKKDFFADQNPRKSFNRSSVARFGTFTGLILGKKSFSQISQRSVSISSRRRVSRRNLQDGERGGDDPLSQLR